MDKSNTDKIDIHLTVEIKPEFLSLFFRLLANGFNIKAEIGSSLKEFFLDRLGLVETYLEDRVQTIFLNGKAVDNIETALITEDSTIALSAAMPGLVGATFRRGGRYAPMREKISYDTEVNDHRHQEGLVFLKLFNMIAKEMGPEILKRGILVKGEDLADLFKNREILSGCVSVTYDNQIQNPDNFDDTFLQEKRVLLKILS